MGTFGHGENDIVRTAGRIFGGLFLGAVLFFGFGAAAHAQTPSPSPSPSPSPNPTPTSTPTPTTAAITPTTSKTTGVLAKTGTDVTVPLELGGAALAITVVLRRVLANG